MEDSSRGLMRSQDRRQQRGRSSSLTQANALLRKNITFQKRNLKTNLCVLVFPILICSLMAILQHAINYVMGTMGQLLSESPVPNPQRWPPFLQVPPPEVRAVKTNYLPFADLPHKSCRKTRSCPAVVLFTGTNQTFATSLGQSLFTNSLLNISDNADTSDFITGTYSNPGSTQFFEPAYADENKPIYILQPECQPNLTIPLQMASDLLQKEVQCIEGLPLWRDSSSVVNDELYKGYFEGNAEHKSNDITTAYDFLTSHEKLFMVNIWYNATYRSTDDAILLRVPRLVNLASNAYLHMLKGAGTKMQFEFVQEMPKQEKKLAKMDVSSIVGQIFFVWIVELLLPVMLTYLVYEKEHKLKLMMKMHGLGDGPYWMISYAYFLFISLLYMLCFVIFGSVLGLKFFTLNDYSIQFVFYFIYINLQIALAFFVASNFSDVKTATVVSYIYVFASGILGFTLFQRLMEDASFSSAWVIVMEIVPGFSLYRGIYEFSQYSLFGTTLETSGMRWADLNDSDNGMKAIMILMSIEWLVLLLFSYNLDKAGSVYDMITLCTRKKPSLRNRRPSVQLGKSDVTIETEKLDVFHEREVVEQLLREPSSSVAIICNNMKKVYPGCDGNPEKFAVQGLSLAVPRGECFGMLGPNGAGKTSWISMMIGLTKPTSGTAYVHGMDILSDMGEVYTRMGVCPQHDLLWGNLTGREHLMFYGRLKNLKGAALTQAVEESLKSVNLFKGGVGDKQAKQYSGGMKRRLSVAIALIGDPKVVYMDEPSTGLDPASRKTLWDVVKKAKRDRAIILTTHSMEEAEMLCDRLGIFVDGSLQCIGNPAELKSRYGGTYVLTITTTNGHEEAVEALVRRLSPKATKMYHLSGTQKFEMPKSDVTISQVFQAVEDAKSKFPIQAWGFADTTLEDVFIKVAKVAKAFNNLS